MVTLSNPRTIEFPIGLTPRHPYGAMVKKMLVIVLVSVVNFSLLAHAAVPHHHHHNAPHVCISFDLDSHELSGHENCDHGAGSGDGGNCCTVKTNLVSSVTDQRRDYRPDCDADHSRHPHYEHLVIELFMVTHPVPAEPTGRRRETDRYSDHYRSVGLTASQGMRAPPAEV